MLFTKLLQEILIGNWKFSAGKCGGRKFCSFFFRELLLVGYHRIRNWFLALWLVVFSMAWDKCMYFSKGE